MFFWLLHSNIIFTFILSSYFDFISAYIAFVLILFNLGDEVIKCFKMPLYSLYMCI